MQTPAASHPGAGSLQLPIWLVAILRIFMTAVLPLILLLLTIRVLFTPLYLRWEYSRPILPPDPYGFTLEERLRYGTAGLEYLFNSEGIDFLGDLRLQNGSPAFNQRELSHMVDVKLVTQKLVRLGYGLLAVYALTVALLAVSPTTRPILLRALFDGAVLTVLLIVAGLVTVAVSFDWLFTNFHHLLQFEGDTWIFPTSDTLIRIYPEQFWIDAFVIGFGSVLVEAIVIGLVTWLLLRRRSRAVTNPADV